MKTKTKIMTKLVSLVLSMVMLFYAVPEIVYAESADAISSLFDGTSQSESSENTDSPFSSSGAVPIYEVEELREENVKHFRLSDGSYIAAQYTNAVHYLSADGSYVDIDNSLRESSGGIYTNATSRVKFEKKVTGNGALFTLKDGNTKLTFSLNGALRGTAGYVINGEESEGLTELQRMMELENLSSRIIYADVLDGVDVEYVLESQNVKENIIVKEKKDSYAYSFEIKLNGLCASLTESGDIRIVNSKSGEDAYIIPAPVIFDANGIYADRGIGAYTLTGGGNGKYTLTVTVSEEWMNAEGRAFPVTVDPTIAKPGTSIVDLMISSSAPDTVDPTSNPLQISHTQIGYVRFGTLPTLPSNAYLSEAKILLWNVMSSDERCVGVYEVTSAWDSTLTWNKHVSTTNPQGQISDKMLSYATISDFKEYSWDITSLVRKWYDNSASNYGVAFQYEYPASYSVFFYSSEHSSVQKRPSLAVTYRNMSGVEPYWSYSSHSAGVAGSGSINLATGGLTLSIPTLSTTDSLMPYTPTLVYNASFKALPYAYPNFQTAIYNAYTPFGFKLNICETVLKKSYVNNAGETVSYYVYADADGTEHGFHQSIAGSSIYYDENGLQKVLTVLSNGTIQITDDSKIVRTFVKTNSGYTDADSGWYLSKITDKNGNSILFTFDSSLRPTKVSMQPNGKTAIAFLDIIYYSTGMLKMIYNPMSRDAVVFRYSQTYNGSISTSKTYYLRQIDYAHGNENVTDANWNTFAEYPSIKTNITVDATAYYEYNSSEYISCITDDLAKQKIQYTSVSNKITTLRQISYDENSITTQGQSINISYGTHYTDVRNSGNDEITGNTDDIITRYVFDRNGRSTSVYSSSADGTEIYGATVGKYEEQENVKNNLKEQTTLGGAAVNYILNGDFEELTSDYKFAHWVTTGGVMVTYGNYDKAAYFNLTPGTTGTLSQTVYLDAGKYTLSFSYATSHSDNCTAIVKVTPTVGTGYYHSEQMALDSKYTYYGEVIFSTTFTIPESTAGVAGYKISIEMTAGANASDSSTLDVDSVMLENNVGASDFSHVSYGSFEASVADTSGNTVALSDYWTTENNTDISLSPSDEKFGASAKVSADIDSEKYIRQRIYQADSQQLWEYYYENDMFISNANNEYILYAFGKAENAIFADKATFGIRVEVIYYQGEYSSNITVPYYFAFEPSCNNWQFTGGTFSTKYQRAANDYKDYSCVYAIDIICEYSYQPEGYALFDNVSVASVTGANTERYYYYDEGAKSGLLWRKETNIYKEYYEYYDDRNISRFANSRGELTDYVYDEIGQLSYSADHTWSGMSSYPYDKENIDTLITKTPKTKTKYTYNVYGLVTSTETHLINESLNMVSGTQKIYHMYEYNISSDSQIFGALVREMDTLGIDIYYFYNEKNGNLLATINYDGESGVCYNYDEVGRLTRVTPAEFEITPSSYTSVTDAESVNYIYNPNGLLSTIETESTTYTFTYDGFGNTTSVSAGNSELAEYTYAEKNGKLQKITYGNGFIVEYVYNELELLREVWYTVSGNRYKAYEYEYTSDGQVHRFTDHVKGRSTVYKYDTNNRLISFVEFENDDNYFDFTLSLSYNNKGDLSGLTYYIKNLVNNEIKNFTWYYSYTRDPDGKLNRSRIRTGATNGNEEYTYDNYDRVTSKLNSFNLISDTSAEFKNQIDYTYSDNINRTSGQVKSYTSTINDGTPLTYTYTYDGNGNITKIVYSTAYELRYKYDDLGQLLREDNRLLDETYTYTYDNAGNITSKTVYYYTTLEDLTNYVPKYTYNYGYSTETWGDRLTSYRGHTITYDAIGNPISYYNGSSYTFAWTGRRLTSATKGGLTYTYTYNDEGIRTSKTVNGVTTTYYLNGSQIIGEETSGNLTLYIYDAEGTPIGMQYHASTYAQNVWDTYWFEKNLQGDIVAVYNTSGTKLVSYIYDAWGIMGAAYSNGGASTTATKNPFRYRGYYYDSDLGFYLTGTRYYDPLIGRFINVDSMMAGVSDSLHGHNLFAYCFNNPVNLTDPSGNWPRLSTIFAIVAVTAIAVAAVATAVVTCGAAVPAMAAVGGGIAGGISAGTIATAAAVGSAAVTIAKVATMASAASYVTEKAVEKTAKRNNSVYVLKDEVGTVQYVGRTNNVDKRKAAHRANPARAELEMEVIASGLNLPEARALEQAGMAYYHTINTTNKMNNQINGVSPKYWGAFKELAIGTLNYAWNQMSNEILYWTGN